MRKLHTKILDFMMDFEADSLNIEDVYDETGNSLCFDEYFANSFLFGLDFKIPIDGFLMKLYRCSFGVAV